MTFMIATCNRHKVSEIRAILGGDFRYLTLADVPGAPAAVEDAPTFAGNAAKKATELAAHLLTHHFSLVTDGAVLADDSGLEVDALGGAPGVHSARFAALDRARWRPPAIRRTLTTTRSCCVCSCRCRWSNGRRASAV